MSIDDKHSDQELKAYLDGRDGVSAAYRKTAHEEPPRALDQAILDAARKHAQPPAEAWYAKRPRYALAASFMIAVVAVSLYFNALDEIAVPAVLDEATDRVVEFQNVERVAEAELDEKVAGAADSAAAPAAPAQARRDTASTASQAPQEQGGQLQEITVTGSRIMRRDEGDVSYRESREDWLIEISAMTKEFAARSQLTTARAAAARLEEQLNEEMDLYLEAYPDADLEAELEALEE